MKRKISSVSRHRTFSAVYSRGAGHSRGAVHLRGAVRWLAGASVLVAVGCSDDDSGSGPGPWTSGTTSSTVPSSTLPTTSPSTPTTSAPTGTVPSTTGPVTSPTTTEPTVTGTSGVTTETSASADTASSLDPASSASSETSVDLGTTDVELPTLDPDAGVDSTSSEAAGDTSTAVTDEPTSDVVSDVPDASVTEESSEDVTTGTTSETSEESVGETATSEGQTSSGDDTAPSPYGANLFTDSGFETGLGSWVGLGDGVVVDRSTTAYAGQYSARATNRGDGWHGIQTNITALVTPGSTYRVDGALQISGVASAQVKLTVKVVCGADAFTPVATGTGTNTAWVTLSGEFTVPSTCEQTQTVWLYAEGPEAGTDLLLDAVSLREVL